MKNFTILLLLSLFGLSGFSQVNLDSGLVVKYYFNGNANDESGNDHNGTVYGAALVPDRLGNSNQAYTFDGSNDYIEAANSSSLDLKPGSFTLSAWCKYTANNPDNAIVSKHYWGQGNGDYILESFENKLTFFLQQTDTITFTGRVKTDETYNDGLWHLIIGVYNDSTQYLYVDGVLKKTKSNVVYEDTNDANIRIGSVTGGAFFNGSIDDIRIYNRALSQIEITALYKENVVTPPTAQSSTRCGSGTITLTASGADSTETYKCFATATDTTVLGTDANFITQVLAQTDTFYVALDSAGYLSARVAAVATIKSLPADIGQVSIGIIIINENFSDSSSLNNWVITTQGNGGTATIVNDSLVLHSNGGSNGFSGVSDIIFAKANYVNIPSDFTNKVIEFNINEIARQNTGGYNEWIRFGFQLYNNDQYDGNSLWFDIFGNWDKNNYSGSPFQSHKIVIKQYINNIPTVLFTDSLNLSSYYNCRVKFINSDGHWSVIFNKGGINDTISSGLNITSSLTLRFWNASGDGGYTYQNGSGTFSIDNFIIKEVSPLSVSLSSDTLMCRN
ncbi:MAG: LamG domain-containing protein [Bacteroidia bacterium]|nr:LamG domain-containing protein [Bacteroidia bacterium]